MDYNLLNVIESDDYFTHYQATDENGEPVIVTEFFPTQMANRSETGEIESKPELEEIYAAALDSFITRANAMSRLNESAFARIETITKIHNTAHILRKPAIGPTLDAYLAGGRMTYVEVFAFFQPFLKSLSRAEENGLYFNVTYDRLYVNADGHLTMDGLFAWHHDIQAATTEMAKLFYRLTTGLIYTDVTTTSHARAIADAPDVKLPVKLEQMMSETISGGTSYDSFDNFYDSFKQIIDAEKSVKAVTKDLPPEEKSVALSKPVVSFHIKKSMLWIAAGLVVLAIGSLLFYFVIVPMYRDPQRVQVSEETEEPAQTEEPAALRQRDYTAFAITDPEDTSVILDGAFYWQEDTLYYSAWQDGYYLAKSLPDGGDSILASDVRPTYITVRDGYVYFCDGLTNYKLYRVATNGGEKQLLTDHAAAFIQIQGSSLFYTNLDDRDRLYRLDLNTLEDAPFIKNAAYETIISGKQLFFVNGNHHFNLYAANMDEPTTLTCLSESNCDNLRLYNGLLFFIDLTENAIQCVTTEGQPVAFNCPVKAQSFDLDGPRLVIVELETNRVYQYDLDAGERKLLSDKPTAYAWAENGTVYAIDYGDCKVTRRLVAP